VIGVTVGERQLNDPPPEPTTDDGAVRKRPSRSMVWSSPLTRGRISSMWSRWLTGAAMTLLGNTTGAAR